MKTPREFIKEIHVNDMNLKHISTTGIINASLLIDIERVMKEYAKQWVNETSELVVKQVIDGNPAANATFEIFNRIDAQ